MPLATFDAADQDALYDGVRTIRWTEHSSAPDDTTRRRRQPRAQGQGRDRRSAARRDRRAPVGGHRRARRAHQRPRARRPRHRLDRSVGRQPAPARLARRRRRGAAQGEPGRGDPAPRRLAGARGKGRAAASIRCAARARCRSRPRSSPPTWRPACSASASAFTGWRGHDAALWQRLVAEARARKRPIVVGCFGFDHDARAVRLARDNVRRAGVADAIDFRVVTLAEADVAVGDAGRRRHEPALRRAARRDARARRRSTSRSARSCATASPAGRASSSPSNPELQKRIGLRAARRHVLFNGPLECRLLELPIAADRADERRCARARRCAPRCSPIACARTART